MYVLQGDMTSAGIEMGNGGDNPLRTVARDGGSREECDAISNVAQRKQHMPQPKEHQSEGNNKPFEQQNEHPRQMEGQAVVQQLAVEAAEKQRIELAQLQVRDTSNTFIRGYLPREGMQPLTMPRFCHREYRYQTMSADGVDETREGF